jgi:hypothetical protein
MLSLLTQIFGRNQFEIPKPEHRMSNKEVRMMKLNLFCCFLRRSSFVIRPARYARKQILYRSSLALTDTAFVTPQSFSQGRRVFCGSLLSFSADCEEVLGLRFQKQKCPRGLPKLEWP